MKHANIILIALFAVIFFVAFGGALPAPEAADAQAEGRVLSATGDVHVKAAGETQWLRVKRGAKIARGGVVKTGPKGFARILSPDGKMIKISSGKEQTLTFSEDALADNESSSGFSAFMSELASPNQRTRITAVRSIMTPLQQDWVAFSQFNYLSPDKIEAALELASAFEKENKTNRSVYILWKLKTFFPDDPGIQTLADQAIRSLGGGGQWIVNGQPLGGEALQIAYSTKQERYVYLFHTIQDQDGKTASTRLFPDSDDLMALEGRMFFAARVAPEEVLSAKEDGVAVRINETPFADVAGRLDKGTPVTVLEKKGRRYQVKTKSGLTGWVLKHKLAGETAAEGKQSGDILAILRVPSDTGHHFLWGWASPGPTPPWAVEAALAKVNKQVSSETALSSDMIIASLPEICQNVQAIYIDAQ